jgi:hypothetical protein
VLRATPFAASLYARRSKCMVRRRSASEK